jgi:hypothetical protein
MLVHPPRSVMVGSPIREIKIAISVELVGDRRWA